MTKFPQELHVRRTSLYHNMKELVVILPSNWGEDVTEVVDVSDSGHDMVTGLASFVFRQVSLSKRNDLIITVGIILPRSIDGFCDIPTSSSFHLGNLRLAEKLMSTRSRSNWDYIRFKKSATNRQMKSAISTSICWDNNFDLSELFLSVLANFGKSPALSRSLLLLLSQIRRSRLSCASEFLETLLLQLILSPLPILTESNSCIELLPTFPIYMCYSLPMNKSLLMLQFGTTILGFITKLGEDGIEIVRELELDHDKVVDGELNVFTFNEKIIGIYVMNALDFYDTIPQNTSVLVPNHKIGTTDPIMRTLDLNRIVHLTVVTCNSIFSGDIHLRPQDPSDLKCSQVSASCPIKRLEEYAFNIDAIDSYSQHIVKLELPSSHLCQRSEENQIHRRPPGATLSTPQLGEDNSFNVIAWLLLGFELWDQIYQCIASCIIVVHLQFALKIIRGSSEMLLEPYLSQRAIQNDWRNPLCLHPLLNTQITPSYQDCNTQLASCNNCHSDMSILKRWAARLAHYSRHVCMC